CHAQVNINSTIGNADYTIEEPIHYPFAYSDHPVLQWMNNQLVKAKPEFHKQTFLKPFHRTAEFCSTCHKVSLPMQVNHYKEFLKDKQVRIDLFGVKDGAAIDAKLIAPLRPQLPKLQPGKTYLVEVVVRTLGLGHPLTQGTADSNELWVDFTAKSGDRVIGRNGALQDEKKQEGPVDEWSHFI